MHKCPVDSNNPLVREPFQRLWKNEIRCAFSLFEPNDSEIRPALALQDCHHAILLYLRLEMTIRSWLLPESINLRLTAFFDDLRKARRFYFKKLHSSGFVSNGAHGVTRPTEQKKSARELRQGGSDYRCCIPALAGFVSPQSIAPDGKQISSQESQRATPNSESTARTSFPD